MATSQVEKLKAENKLYAKITNNSVMEMKLLKSRSWAGSPDPATGFPAVIQPGQSAVFTHNKDGGFGSRAAVVYSGYNQTVSPCAWILAWYAPTNPDTHSNQVYVECGSIVDIDSIPWSQIEITLDQASDFSSNNDEGTKTKAIAKYEPNSTPPPTMTLEAGFGLM